eukprot:353852-Chlamydomonas_euryale.AAC.3
MLARRHLDKALGAGWGQHLCMLHAHGMQACQQASDAGTGLSMKHESSTARACNAVGRGAGAACRPPLQRTNARVAPACVKPCLCEALLV